MPTRTVRRFRAFTLIELLVVISILCLLLAILLPSFARAKQYAQRMTCFSQVEGMSRGFSGYAADNGGAVPQGGGECGVLGLDPGWGGWGSPWRDSGGTYWPNGCHLSNGWPMTQYGSYPGWDTLVAPYFDGDAKPGGPPGYPLVAHIGYQPWDGDYYKFAGIGVVLSKRMHCPQQPRTWSGYIGPWGDPHPPPAGVSLNYRYNRNYDGTAVGINNMNLWDGYDIWKFPPGYTVNTANNPQKDKQPSWGAQPHLSDFPVDRFVYIMEPTIDDGCYGGYDGFAIGRGPRCYADLACYDTYPNIGPAPLICGRSMCDNLPHQDGNDTCGNFGFLDGHVQTMTRTFIRNLNWVNAPGPNGVGAGNIPVPFGSGPP